MEVDDDEVELILKEYDQDGNGEIDKDEFLDMMAKQLTGVSKEEVRRQAFKVSAS